MLEAEGVAKRAEEELAVAKERLLLQEDELQSRAGSLSLSGSACLAFLLPVCWRTLTLAKISRAECVSISQSDVVLIRLLPCTCNKCALFKLHEGKQFYQCVITARQQKQPQFYFLHE